MDKYSQFCYITSVISTINEKANLTSLLYFGKRHKFQPNRYQKLDSLHQVRRDLQKYAKKTQDEFKHPQEITNNLENLFDISHADALQLIKIEYKIKYIYSIRESKVELVIWVEW